MLRHCELFGGIGGFSQAIRQYFPQLAITTDYVDIDEDAIAVYESHFPTVTIHRDIRTFLPRRGKFNLITCGFPCTGTSNAGSRTGLHHPESSLWREGLRILHQARPQYFIWEQPVGVTHRGLRAILGGCRMAGYQTQLIHIKASDLGAAHRRERLFIVAYPDHGNRLKEECWQREARATIEKIRRHSQWLSIIPGGNGDVHGFSPCLVQGNYTATFDPDFITVPNGLRRRNDIRRLAGKTVTPAQAAIAISFVDWHLNL